MDDPRWQPGMPALDRQASARDKPDGSNGTTGAVRPRSVPEREPTPLQRHYINLSAIALVCGAVAISAIELGVPLGSPLIKACVILGAPLLALTTADAALRIWRSARAWMPVDPGKAWFRVSWLAAALILMVALLGATLIVLRA
jgi:hypothetical protein